jgi:hypothetical protein
MKKMGEAHHCFCFTDPEVSAVATFWESIGNQSS